LKLLRSSGTSKQAVFDLTGTTDPDPASKQGADAPASRPRGLAFGLPVLSSLSQQVISGRQAQRISDVAHSDLLELIACVAGRTVAARKTHRFLNTIPFGFRR
jgi:hypothetical protein